MSQRNVGILVFENVEVLDFCGPFEVFSVARLNEQKRREESSPFNVFLVAEAKDPVVTTGGMRVLPDFDFGDCPTIDVLVVPGGWGTRREMNNETLVHWIADRSTEVKTLASVCTGALLLGKAGLLDRKRATTHWQALGLLRESFPEVTVEEKLRVVEQGDLITSAGIAAGIDMAFRVVSRYFGEAVARATARYMEYPFPDGSSEVRSSITETSVTSRG